MTIDDALKKSYSEISATWDKSIIPTLMEYIKIPNKSPMFDADWNKNGYLDDAVNLLMDWGKQQAISGMSLEIIKLEGRTPLIFGVIEGHKTEETILLYGHMDKQPEMTGWESGLGPTIPVLRDGKLYGRGGADDGYALFAQLTAIANLQRLGIPHARCVILIEGCEESGSYDLPFYLEHLQDRIGDPSLVICLDSGAGNYEQMWCTTSLRGILGGTLRINVTKEGIHSGIGSGVVPATFRILRQLLDRIEDSNTGQFLLKEFFADVPKQRTQQAKAAAQQLGHSFLDTYAFAGQTKPQENDIYELILNRTWRPALSIVGIDGIPALKNAGNVTLPSLAVKLSVRTPPTVDIAKATAALKRALEQDPPYGAQISFTPEDVADGWHAPELSPWLAEAADHASQLFYQKPAAYLGEGGSIPFMAILGKKYPRAQFLIVGVLGPKSNAHGPNEFLHIDMGKKLTGCMSSVIAAHYQQVTA